MPSLDDLIRMQKALERLAADKRASSELREEARRQGSNLAKLCCVRRQRDFFDAALSAPKPTPGGFPQIETK